MVRKRILEMTLNWSLRTLESEVVTSWKEDDGSHFEANELWSWWWPFIFFLHFFVSSFLHSSFLHSSFLLPSLMRTPSSSFYFPFLFSHYFFWFVTKSKEWNISHTFSFFLQTRLISFLRSIEQFVKNENISLASVQSLCVTSFSSIALGTNGVEEVYERSCVVGSDGKETKKRPSVRTRLPAESFPLFSFFRSQPLTLDPSVTFRSLILIIRCNHWSSHRMVVNQWNTINFIPFDWFSLSFLTLSSHGFCSNPSCVIFSSVISLNSPSTTLISPLNL